MSRSGTEGDTHARATPATRAAAAPPHAAAAALALRQGLPHHLAVPPLLRDRDGARWRDGCGCARARAEQPGLVLGGSKARLQGRAADAAAPGGLGYRAARVRRTLPQLSGGPRAPYGRDTIYARTAPGRGRRRPPAA